MNLGIKYPFDKKVGISQAFGENPANYARYGYAGHFGIDFLTPFNSMILACSDGTVTRSSYSSGNGYYVELSHSWGYSLYLHLSKASLLKVGEKILSGGLIGLAGNTGDVIPKPTAAKPYAGTHLHFSIKIKGMHNPAYKDFIDPFPFFV